MSRFKLKINLLKLQGAFVTTIKGKTETKRCVIIPINDAHLFAGEKGIYLNMQALEFPNGGKYGDSHMIKQEFQRGVYQAMSDDDKKKLAILGSMKAFQNDNPTSVSEQIDIAEQESGDLPF